MKKLRDPLQSGELLEVFVVHEAAYLRNFLMNYIRCDGMPEEVDMRYFNDALIARGFVGLIYHSDRIGFLACDGALPGVDRYYRPTDFQGICAALPNIRQRKIYYKTDANIVRGDTKRMACVCYNTLAIRTPQTMAGLIYTTAHMLAEIDLSMMTSCRNSRVALLPIVHDQEEAIRTSRTLQDIYEGKPASIVYRSGFNRDVEIVPIKARDNIVTSELADARRNVLSDFLRRLGVDNIAVDKKERTNLEEMESNKQELNVNTNIYLAARKLFAEECNQAFGLDITFTIDDEIVNDFLEDGLPADMEAMMPQEEGGESDAEEDHE